MKFIRLLGLIAALFSFACAHATYMGRRDQLALCSKPNIFQYRVQVYLEDDRGQQQWVGFMDPGGHVCTTWPFGIEARGRWGYAPSAADSVTWDMRWFDAFAVMHGYKP